MAQFSADARSPGAVIEAADIAMYRTKEGGRNRVVLGTGASAPQPASA